MRNTGASPRDAPVFSFVPRGAENAGMISRGKGAVHAGLRAIVFLWVALGLGRRPAAAGEVPRPYTAVEASDRGFRCLGRRVELGDLLLPTRVTAGGEPVLAGAVRLVAEPDVLAGMSGSGRVVERAPDRARWEWVGESAGFRVVGGMTAECDGFCWYEIRLEPKRPVALRRLALEIPRVGGTARYLHTANYSWSNVSGGLPEMGGKWAGAFVPYVWLGDEERGLAWCAESDEGWHVRDGARALGVETRGDGVVVFRANVIDGERTVAGPIVLRFGLQATPVKSFSFADRARLRILHDIHYSSIDPGPDGRCELDAIADGGARTVVIHDSWTAYFGQMVPADPAKFRRLIDECHRRGLRLLVYVGYGVARTAPELKGRHDAWSVLPLIPWDPTYKPQTRAFDATCPRGEWADWLVAGVERVFADYDLDGLYFDGTAYGWPCRNAAHGCGWTDEHGNARAVYPLLSARSLMRRIADAVHRRKPDATLDVHMSSNMTMPTLSFCDSAWNGEQFEGHTAGERFNVPLHAFRTEFMGYAHGIDTEFLCYEKRPFTFDEAIALAWVHGVEVRPYPKSLSKVTPIWRAMDRFGTNGAAWRPYWAKEPAATADRGDVKVSAWVRDGRALLVVSHLNRERVTARVRVDRAGIGLTAGTAVRVTDAVSGAPIRVNTDEVEMPFDGMTYRLVEVAR